MESKSSAASGLEGLADSGSRINVDEDGNESMISMSLESSAGDMARTKSSSTSGSATTPKMILPKEFRKEAEDALRNPDVRSILGLHRATTCTRCGSARQKAAAALAKKSKTTSSATDKLKAAKLKRKKNAIKTSKAALASKSVAPVGTGGIPYCNVFSARDYLHLYASQQGKCKYCLHTELTLPNMSVARQPISTGHLLVLNDKIISSSKKRTESKEYKESKEPKESSKETKDGKESSPTAAAAALVEEEDSAMTVKETLNCKTKHNVSSLVCGACIQIVKGCANKSELMNRVRHSWFQAAVDGTIKSARKTKDGQLIVQSRYWPRLDKLPFEHDRADGKEYASIDTPNMPAEFGRKKQPLHQKWLEQQGCVAYSLPPKLQAAMTEERNKFLEARRAAIAKLQSGGDGSAGSSSVAVEQPVGRQEDHPNRVYADLLPEDELVFPRLNKRKAKKGAAATKAAEDAAAATAASQSESKESPTATVDMDEDSNGEQDNGNASDGDVRGSDDEEEQDDDDGEEDGGDQYDMPIIDKACWIEPDKLMERRSDIIQFMIAIDPRACAARNGTMTSLAYTPMDRSRAMGTTNFLLVNRQLDKIERSFEYDDFMSWATKVLIRHVRPVFCFDMGAATKANSDFVQRGHSIAKHLKTLYDREEDLAAKMKPQTDELKKTRKVRTQVQNSYSDFLVKAVENDVSLSFLTDYKLVVTRSGVAKKNIAAAKAGTAAAAAAATKAKARAAAPASVDAKIVREIITKSMSDKARPCFVADEIARSEAIDQLMKDIYKFHAQLAAARALNSKANDQPRFRVRRLKLGAKGTKGGRGAKKRSVKSSSATSSSTTSAGSAEPATPAPTPVPAAEVGADADVSAGQTSETKHESSPKKKGSKRKRQETAETSASYPDSASTAAATQTAGAGTGEDESESTPAPRPLKRARIAASS
jgi:hypothetical protein